MTLDEAIKRAEEVADGYDRLKKVKALTEYECICANDHRQLAEWLKELKTKREKLDRIAELINEVDLADMTQAQLEHEVDGCSIGEIKDNMWQLYCLISDISFTLKR